VRISLTIKEISEEGIRNVFVENLAWLTLKINGHVNVDKRKSLKRVKGTKCMNQQL
jgi:hypothetical protein